MFGPYPFLAVKDDFPCCTLFATSRSKVATECRLPLLLKLLPRDSLPSWILAKGLGALGAWDKGTLMLICSSRAHTPQRRTA